MNKKTSIPIVLISLFFLLIASNNPPGDLEQKYLLLNRLIKNYSNQSIFCLDLGEEYHFTLKDQSKCIIKLIVVKDYKDKAELSFQKPGVYMAELWIQDDRGNEDVDFCKIKVYTKGNIQKIIPAIFMCHTPTLNIKSNEEITFQLWLQAENEKKYRSQLILVMVR